MKTKVAHGGRDLAVLDQECAVSCHACQREVRWIDGSDVPEIRHKDRPLALLNQFLCLECRRPGRGQARRFQRRDALDSLLFGGEPVIRQLLQHALVYPHRVFARQSFMGEPRTQQVGMSGEVL